MNASAEMQWRLLRPPTSLFLANQQNFGSNKDLIGTISGELVRIARHSGTVRPRAYRLRKRTSDAARVGQFSLEARITFCWFTLLVHSAREKSSVHRQY
jgi:hypothetical protein